MPQQAAKTDKDDTPGGLEALIGYNLKRAYVIVAQDLGPILGQDGLSTRVFTALSLAIRCPNITQSELARLMGIERSGLVSIVDQLERLGHLRRAPVPGDRRVQALVPTPAGHAAHAAALAKIEAHEGRMLDHLSEAEKDTLLTLLRRIRQREG